MTQIATRVMNADDVPVVLSMVHALAAFNGDKSTLTQDALKRDALADCPWITVLVAESSERVVGYAALCSLAQLQFGVRGVDIHHLFVTQSVRGQGVGKQLISACIARSKEMGCRYILIGTQPENTKAQKIYLSAGFSKIPAPGPRFRIKFDGD